MNLDRVVQVLKKVNALVENLDEQGQTSAIEKDLLKRYLRDLYEHVSETESGTKRKAEQQPITSRPGQNHIPESPAAEVKAEKPTEQNTDPQQPLFSPENQTTYYDAESEKVPAETKVPEPPQEEEIPSHEPTQYFPPEPETKSASSAQVPTSSSSEEHTDVAVKTMSEGKRFAAVFAEPDATDLADKFKLQPIQSIESAMGINQRLQTINELFEGDNSAFVQTLKKLNEVSNFSAAKEVLIKGPAPKFNWDSDDKSKLARDFVELVRRKYI